VVDEEPTFSIPRRPTRRYRSGGGVEYEGETVFTLRPERDPTDRSLTALVESVLDRGPYRYGDWFDLPMPVYLVHDDKTGDTFRVAVRDGTVQLHVLPNTDRAGLRAFYRRLAGRTESAWSVTCRTTRG